eukprot:3346038-Pleurochrysis_carterae.AAC.2
MASAMLRMLEAARRISALALDASQCHGQLQFTQKSADAMQCMLNDWIYVFYFLSEMHRILNDRLNGCELCIVDHLSAMLQVLYTRAGSASPIQNCASSVRVSNSSPNCSAESTLFVYELVTFSVSIYVQHIHVRNESVKQTEPKA